MRGEPSCCGRAAGHKTARGALQGDRTFCALPCSNHALPPADAVASAWWTLVPRDALQHHRLRTFSYSCYVPLQRCRCLLPFDSTHLLPTITKFCSTTADCLPTVYPTLYHLTSLTSRANAFHTPSRNIILCERCLTDAAGQTRGAPSPTCHYELSGQRACAAGGHRRLFTCVPRHAVDLLRAPLPRLNTSSKVSILFSMPAGDALTFMPVYIVARLRTRSARRGCHSSGCATLQLPSRILFLLATMASFQWTSLTHAGWIAPAYRR